MKEKTEKSLSQRVNERVETLCVNHEAAVRFEATQRANGSHMRRLLQRAIDARTIKALAPYVQAVAVTHAVETAQLLGISVPTAAIDGVTPSVNDA